MINFQDDQDEWDAIREPEQNLYELRYGDPETLNRFRPLLDGETEFLMDGDGSDSPLHRWRMAYWLRTSKSGRYFGLAVADYGDAQDHDQEDGFSSISKD